MTNEATSPTDPPACERCGGNMFATKRTMRTYDISSGQAVPHDASYPVWRCFRCAAETPRSA